MKAHKPEMIAAWAKENKVKGWEHLYRAYDPKEQAKRRHWAMKSYNRKEMERKNELRQTFKKGR